MLISVKGKSVEMSDALRRYAESRIQKLEKYLPNIREAQIVYSAERGKHIVEVQLEGDGFRLRGEERGDDLQSSIDEVIEKLEKRIYHFKGRIYQRRKGEGSKEKEARKEALTEEAFIAEAEPDEEQPAIVRTKRFTMKPMTPDEATLEMELLHHTFFVFRNAQTGDVNVVYKRRDGNYGLIEPEA